MTTTPPNYQPPPSRTYTDLGWTCAALTGPATFLAVWIYGAVAYGFLLGFFLAWIPALILALFVALAMIYFWPLAAMGLLYAIYRILHTYPHLLNYIAGFITFALLMAWVAVEAAKDNQNAEGTVVVRPR